MNKIEIRRKLKNYVRLMHTLNIDNAYLNYMAFLTFLQLKDKRLKKKVIWAANSDVTKITMSLISHTLSKTYPILCWLHLIKTYLSALNSEMPGRINRHTNYAGLAMYVHVMQEQNLSYINLLAYIHFLTMENEEMKSIILAEVDNDVTKITYDIITIVQCMFDHRQNGLH